MTAGVPSSFSTGHALFLVLSNLAFVPAIAAALWKRAFLQAAWFTATMIISTIYHLCSGGFACMFLEHAMSQLDFVFAMGSVPVSIDYLLPFDAPRYKGAADAPRWFSFVLYLSVVVARVLISRTAPATFYWIVFTGVFVVVLKWLLMDRGRIYFSDYNWLCLVVGTAFVGSGLGLFFVGANNKYWWTHSLWHIVVFIGEFFYMLGRRVPTASAQRKAEEKRELDAKRKKVEEEAMTRINANTTEHSRRHKKHEQHSRMIRDR